MVFVNPWAFYHPREIIDLTPDKNGVLVYFLCAICGCIISSIIYLPLFYLCFTYTKGALRSILILIESAIILPIIMICLLKLSFKIGDKINNRKKFNNNESKI